MGGFEIRHGSNPPCKDCTNRNATCHASCVAYADWKAERESVMEPQKRERIVIAGYIFEQSARNKRYEFAKRKEGR